MKKLYTLAAAFALLFALNSFASAQTLTFCENVDSRGNPSGYSSTFNIGSGGGYLYFLVNLPFQLNSRQVKYDIFKVTRGGSENFDNTIYQDTERTWDFFYKQVTFYDVGTYNIYVYDNENNFLTSGTITVQWK